MLQIQSANTDTNTKTSQGQIKAHSYLVLPQGLIFDCSEVKKVLNKKKINFILADRLHLFR